MMLEVCELAGSKEFEKFGRLSQPIYQHDIFTGKLRRNMVVFRILVLGLCTLDCFG